MFNPRPEGSSRRFHYEALIVLLLVGLACSRLQLATPTEISPVVTPLESSTETAFATNTAIPPTEVAVITPDSQVKRLTAAVFAGASDPLTELISGDLFALESGGMVTTDALGEAEIRIQDCLKLFVFQDSSLTRSTCRKEDAQNGLAVCSTAGLTGVLNNCSSQVNIQTPAARVVTDGTWFTVLYLPDDQLSIVQVYEGAVGVQGLIDPQSRNWAEQQRLTEGNLWFTAPGEQAPNINGIEGRTAQPMEVWQAIRPALIDKYPELDKWFVTAEDRANIERLAFPDYLAPPQGVVTFHVAGTPWNDDAAQEAFLRGVDWKNLMKQAFPDAEVTPSVEFSANDRVVADARVSNFNVEAAQTLLSNRSDFYNHESSDVQIAIPTTKTSYLLADLANSLQEILPNAGFNVSNVFEGSLEEILTSVKAAESGADFPLIWLEGSGEYFTP